MPVLILIMAISQLLLAMINHRLTLRGVVLSVLLIFCSLFSATAQFINLQLEVDSKLTATTERPLDFGTIATNSGQRNIDLGSINMGVFSITALEKQLLLIKLGKPNYLRHDNPAIKDTVPLDLFARYGYDSQNYNDSAPLPEETNNIKVEYNSDPGPWNTIYIFMYGSITVDDISDGVYSNNIILNVEYI